MADPRAQTQTVTGSMVTPPGSQSWVICRAAGWMDEATQARHIDGPGMHGALCPWDTFLVAQLPGGPH